MITDPLHKPLSSNVPIRIFRIHGSLVSSSLADSEEVASLFSLTRWASKRPLIESTVVSNPRLPKKSVGAGGCFCDARTFCANLVWALPLVAPEPSSDTPGFAGRPSKLSPGPGPQHVVRETRKKRRCLRTILD